VSYLHMLMVTFAGAGASCVDSILLVPRDVLHLASGAILPRVSHSWLFEACHGDVSSVVAMCYDIFGQSGALGGRNIRYIRLSGTIIRGTPNASNHGW
jgi:hypothetical protein